MAGVLAADVESPGVGAVAALVAVGRAVQHHHLLSGRDRGALDRHLACGGAGQRLHAGLEPQALGERARDEVGVGGEHRTLVRVPVEQCRRVGDQVAGGVVAAGDDHEAESQDVPVGEGLALDLGPGQCRDEVIARCCPPLGDQRTEVLEHRRHGLHGAARQSFGAETLLLQRGERGHPGVEERTVGLRKVEQVRQHERGHLRGEVAMQVDRLAVDVAATQVREPAAHELADHRLGPGHPSRREGLGQQAALGRVFGRVHHHDGRGQAEPGDLVPVEGQTACRGEQVRGGDGGVDVRVARQRPELRAGQGAVTGVVMDGVGIAQRPVGGVRVGQLGGVERVEHGGGGAGGG